MMQLERDARHQSALGHMDAKTTSQKDVSLTNGDSGLPRIALVASDTERAEEARAALVGQHDWCPLEEARVAVVLGGDGFMLQTLHAMLDAGRVIPAYGINLGTVGFMMNPFDEGMSVLDRLSSTKSKRIAPLRIKATTQDGAVHQLLAINELSLLRETRQTAKIEIIVGSRVRIAELVGDGVLVATPAGSTAYNFSANGPILPLGSQMLALTPISPFRPRRWRGAILPDQMRIKLRVLDPVKRPVSAVADQKEVRDIAEVLIEVAHDTELELLFDPGQSLEDRIVSEQFAVD